MDSITLNRLKPHDGFDRLQDMLLAMKVGDEMRPGEAADETGLSPETCRAVLLGLERAGLMTRHTNNVDCFVRRRLDLGV